MLYADDFLKMLAPNTQVVILDIISGGTETIYSGTAAKALTYLDDLYNEECEATDGEYGLDFKLSSEESCVSIKGNTCYITVTKVYQ